MSGQPPNASRPDETPSRPDPNPAERRGLFDEATREADRYKWIQSEKAGHDLGDGALHEWHKNYWRSWCRERWIEHLRGDSFWIELDRDDYGLLKRHFHDNLELAGKIVDKIRSGGENLDIIQWASEEKHDLNAVIEVLRILDINSRRLAPPTEYSLSKPLAAEDETEPPSGRMRRVLVVDDDEDTRILLKEVLEKEGLECTYVGTGEEAIREVEKRRFHCFLIDIMLPGKHGAEVAWYLRRHGVTAPVIAISAILNRWNEDDLYDCGFTGLMAKPFHLDELRDLAREVASSATPIHTRD
ncbi:MAG: response regulator [Planctomycetota bacterium]